MLALSLLAFRSLVSNRLRTAVVVGAVLLSISAFSAVLLTNDAIARGLEIAVRTTIGDSQLQARAVSSIGFADSSIARVRAIPDVTRVAATARKRVFYRTALDHGFVELIAVDPIAEPQVRDYRVTAGRFLAAERPDGVVTRASWAEDHGLRVGDSLELITQDGLTRFELIGVLAGDEAGIATYGQVIMVSLATAREQFGMEGRVSSLALVLRSDVATAAVRDALGRALPEGHVIRTTSDVRAELGRSVSELQAFLLLFGATALFVAIFLILNTLEMTVVEQIREIGQLRAAGATRRQILGYFLLQGLIPGLGGAAAGSLAGFVLSLLLATWIARSQDVAIAPVLFSPLVAVVSTLIGLIVVGLSSLSPAIRASRKSPVDLLRESDLEASTTNWRLVGLGCALVALAAIGILAPIPGPTGRLLRALLIFPLLAGFVFASRAAIVPLARLIGVPVQRLAGGSARLAARNLVRHVGRTSLTVAGFLVSLALLVGVASVAASSIQAGERWTLSLIPSDYVIVSPVDQPPIFVDEFAGLSGVAFASPVLFFPARSGDSVIQLAAIEPAVFGRGFDFVAGDKSTALAALEFGGAVFVPRRLANARGLGIGDTITLQTNSGSRPFQVAAIIAHSFPAVDGGSTILISRAEAERSFAQQGFRLLMVQPAAGANSTEVATRVAALAERYGMTATTAQNIAAEVAAALARLLALMGALVGIGLLIGAFGTANTMLMNLVERKRELAVLWAAGMSRAQLRTMAVAEAGMMGLMGGILGTLVGGILSWLLVSFSRTPGFEPEYVFPWPAALVGIALAIAAACVAAVLPAQRIVALAGR